MNSSKKRAFTAVIWASVVSINLLGGFASRASAFQLVSASDPALGPPAGGGGDSYLPVMTRDGRFVLFASTANNLVQIATNRPIPALFPAPLNVYLRDRTKGTTTLISVSIDGTGGGNADCSPVGVSTNGRYALFESSASNLVPGDTNNASDVFLRDVLSGTTTLVSASTNGGCADNASYNSTMTPDGRFIAFASAADNLVPGDTNGIPDIFLRDLQTNTTTLVSVGAGSDTNTYSFAASDAPKLTPDGRYVAFYSTAANLAPGIATFGNIYLRDTVTKTTVCASSGALAALQALAVVTNAVSFNHALSDNGQFIAFESTVYPQQDPAASVILSYKAQTAQTGLIDTNAVAPTSTSYQDIQDLSITPDGRFVAYVANAIDNSGETTAIHLWDAQTGSNTLVSANAGDTVTAGSLSDSPVMDDTGRVVVFLSSATDLVTNNLPGDFHLYARDVQAGITTLVDADTNNSGSPINPVTTIAMSADGRWVAFESQDGDLVPQDRNRAYDVFTRDLTASATELISAHDPGLPSLTPDGISALSLSSVSFDAHRVAFWSEADDLVAGDANGLRDVFVRDLTTGTNWLVSANTNGSAGDGFSTDPAISGDGRFVAFTSQADDLVSGDINQSSDVFVRDLQTGITTLASVNAAGTGPGNTDSFSPLLNSNGQFVLFHSTAGNLTPGMTAGIENLFLRDLTNLTTRALTTNGVTAAVTTPDGARVAYITSTSRAAPASDRLYVQDSQSGSVLYGVTNVRLAALAISADGQRLAYTTNNSSGWGLWGANLALNTNWLIALYGSASSSPPRLSADGRFLVYTAQMESSNTINQIFLYDFQSGTNMLISHSYNGSGPGDGQSDSPDISPDGKFVAYRSAADNLVPSDANGVPDVFLYNVASGATTLVSASRFTGGSADNRSLTPVFSGDAQTLVLCSWASDLVPFDFNNSADIFAFPLYDGQILAIQVSVQPATGSGLNTWLSWPVVSGKAYHVQFKNNLNDPLWQELGGQVTISGNRGSLKDGAGPTSRFYRVVAY